MPKWRSLLALGGWAMTMHADAAVAPAPQTAELSLPAPDGRSILVRVAFVSGGTDALPLLLFSHGANSNAAKYDRATLAWAARGFVVAAPLHVDSPDHAGGGKVDPARGLALRLVDMAQIVDRVDAIEAATGRRIDRSRIIAAGHSYGALVAQVLGGARMANAPAGDAARDRRIVGIVALSPPGPIASYIEAAGWSRIAVPMFVQTGTNDVLPGIAPTWQAHTASFDAATTSPRILFVGRGVDHYFGNIIGRPERVAPDQSAAFDCAIAASSAFIDAVTGRNRSARLDQPCPDPTVATITLR